MGLGYIPLSSRASVCITKAAMVHEDDLPSHRTGAPIGGGTMCVCSSTFGFVFWALSRYPNSLTYHFSCETVHVRISNSWLLTSVPTQSFMVALGKGLTNYFRILLRECDICIAKCLTGGALATFCGAWAVLAGGFWGAPRVSRN